MIIDELGMYLTAFLMIFFSYERGVALNWVGRVKWLALTRWLVLIVVMTIFGRFCVPHHIGLAVILGVGAGSGIDTLFRTKFRLIPRQKQNSNKRESRE